MPPPLLQLYILGMRRPVDAPAPRPGDAVSAAPSDPRPGDTPAGRGTEERGGSSQRRRASESLEMDARPRQTPAALSLLLLFPMFSGSQVLGYGDDLGVGGMTTLQKHAASFDGDKDGVVTFSETYEEKLNTLKDQLRGLEASLAEAMSTQLRKESECKLTSESIPNDTA